MSKIPSFVAFLLMMFYVQLLHAQILETKHSFAVDVGFMAFKGTGNGLFFPNAKSQNGTVIGFHYMTKAMPWLSVGVQVNKSRLSDFSYADELLQVQSSNENILSAGPLFYIHTPYIKVGWKSRITLGLLLTSEYYSYTGNRSVTVNNYIDIGDGYDITGTELNMDRQSNGFGVGMGPMVSFRVGQDFGVKASFCFNWRNVYTGYSNEPTLSTTAGIGLVYAFGREKQFYNF
jgi:hypothetical protein